MNYRCVEMVVSDSRTMCVQVSGCGHVGSVRVTGVLLNALWMTESEKTFKVHHTQPQVHDLDAYDMNQLCAYKTQILDPWNIPPPATEPDSQIFHIASNNRGVCKYSGELRST